ncbi:MAG: alpha/beta fold hydrolase, partial [Myxococcales bacterium]|nr:alpha/beta fold hydrolase [Myxococcales bacterium]
MLVAASLLALVGCSESAADEESVEQRTVEVRVPASYDPEREAPLLILLHGYTSSGANHERYLKLGPALDEAGILYVHPDGSRDCRGDRHWDATEACCHFCGARVDDTAYLRAMIDDIGKRYRVDARRIYIVGHSNGGFMGYRLACEHADIVAAVVSIAGATLSDTERCSPDEPVHILQIHGDRDGTVPFRGAALQG